MYNMKYALLIREIREAIQMNNCTEYTCNIMYIEMVHVKQ